MLMRTDPFRDFDRLAQQVLGTPARPAAMPIDAFRQGDEFIIHFDLPGVDASSIDLTVEKNVLTVHAQRNRSVADDVEMIVAERPHVIVSWRLDVDGRKRHSASAVLTEKGVVVARARALWIDLRR